MIATQNPVGASGTQLLPDSQMDRFMLRLSIGYPAPEDEIELLRRKQKGQPLDLVRQVMDSAGLEQLRRQAAEVYMSDEVIDYIVRLVGETRRHSDIVQGASPRAALHWRPLGAPPL